MGSECKQYGVCLVFDVVMHFAALHGVFHQHGDGHGTHAAGNRGDGAGNVDRFVKSHVALEDTLAVSGLTDFVDADIDDHRSGFDHVALDVFGHAGGGNDNISPSCSGI